MNTKRRAPKLRQAPDYIVPGLSKLTFAKIAQPPTGANESVLTAGQFAEQVGCGPDKSRDIIRRLISSGWAEPAQQEYINMAGVRTRRPAYRFGKVAE
jgi:hypothetical protein